MKGNGFQEKEFLSRDEAFPLYSLSCKYDIVQTAMFEADTTALTALVPLGASEPRGQTKLASDEDTHVC